MIRLVCFLVLAVLDIALMAQLHFEHQQKQQILHDFKSLHESYCTMDRANISLETTINELSRAQRAADTGERP